MLSKSLTAFTTVEVQATRLRLLSSAAASSLRCARERAWVGARAGAARLGHTALRRSRHSGPCTSVRRVGCAGDVRLLLAQSKSSVDRDATAVGAALLHAAGPPRLPRRRPAHRTRPHRHRIRHGGLLGVLRPLSIDAAQEDSGMQTWACPLLPRMAGSMSCLAMCWGLLRMQGSLTPLVVWSTPRCRGLLSLGKKTLLISHNRSFRCWHRAQYRPVLSCCRRVTSMSS